MASIYGSAVKGSYTWQLRLDYTITQNEENNCSYIACTLYLYCPTGNSWNEVPNSAYYVICGNKTYQTYNFDSRSWFKLGNRTITVNHEADGSKSYTLSAAWFSGEETTFTPASVSLSKTIDLPRINRGTAWVNVNGTWKRAVPWVNVNGTWKRTQSFVNASGAWKRAV